ncbi:MAG: molybdopterin molybdotransferase MoeA [archaeon]|nr:molybdopterin molybdotransferase MoeA [archaeon]
MSDKLHSAQIEKQSEEEDHIHYHGVDKAQQHISVKDALDRFLSEISPMRSEIVKLSNSLGRVSSVDIKSRLNIPRYDRSTRDGYAIKVINDLLTPGSKFRIIGEVRIGRKVKRSVNGGEAVQVATGSFLPFGANAVVMKEYAEVEENGSALVIKKEVRAGDNILHAGEDIEKGSAVLLRGTTIHPHHIALLALIGAKRIQVFRRPRVAFFSTGDELVDINTSTRNPGEKTLDINRPFIESMTRELGALPIDLGIAKDDFQTIRKKIKKGLSFDALILSAGSSVGERDFVARAAESIKGVKTLVHGVAMRPSSPTGLALYKGKPFIMLPGFPTSMIVSFFVFARAAIMKLSGSPAIFPHSIKARLESDFEGREGITHFLRLRVEVRADGKYFAKIVKPTEAQYSSWLKEANGIGVLDQSKSSLKVGDILNVYLIGDVLQFDATKNKSYL